VRHTDADDDRTDEQTLSLADAVQALADDDAGTNRTRKDLRAVARYVDGEAGTVDTDRKARLVEHGWVTDNDCLTTDGIKIGRVVSTISDDLDIVVHIMGMPAFVDACLSNRAVVDIVDYLRGVIVVDAVAGDCIDDMRADNNAYVDTVSYADFDVNNGTVEVVFQTKQGAFRFIDQYVPDRYDHHKKHDERFTRNRNPRRRIVTVTDFAP
jgi:hypothetical protein